MAADKWLVCIAVRPCGVPAGLCLAALLPTVGAIGAAIAAIVTSISIFVQLALSARQILRQPLKTNPPDSEGGVDSQP